MIKSQQQGFVLFDSMLAILLLTVILWALLGLFQAYRSQYAQLQSIQQTWRYAHFLLETYPDTQVVKLPSQWQKQIIVTHPEPLCEKVDATVISPLGKKAQLLRWYCEKSQESDDQIN